jgi:hypothetical protein
MSSYCRCKFSFDDATQGPAKIGDRIVKAWICGRCKKAHHAVQEEGKKVRGPANATALLHANGRSTGLHELTWATPNGHVKTIEYHPYPRTVNMSNPEPLLFSLWELLQSKVKVIVDEKPNDEWDPNEIEAHREWNARRNEARGIAEALAILMQPFLTDADAVVRAAVKFYKDPWYEVPGLGAHLWNPLYNPDGSYRTPLPDPPKARTRTAIKAPAKPKPKLSEADVTFIKASSEMFSKEDLAGMFKVSVAEVEAVLA